MPLSPSLWDDLTPPAVWVTLSTVEHEEHDFIRLTVRIKEGAKRSLTASVNVTRYSPTSSVMLAVSKALGALAAAQCPLDKALLKEQLTYAVSQWVDPF
jgi:hypothetical protein